MLTFFLADDTEHIVDALPHHTRLQPKMTYVASRHRYRRAGALLPTRYTRYSHTIRDHRYVVRPMVIAILPMAVGNTLIFNTSPVTCLPNIIAHLPAVCDRRRHSAMATNMTPDPYVTF